MKKFFVIAILLVLLIVPLFSKIGLDMPLEIGSCSSIGLNYNLKDWEFGTLFGCGGLKRRHICMPPMIFFHLLSTI